MKNKLFALFTAVVAIASVCAFTLTACSEKQDEQGVENDDKVYVTETKLDDSLSYVFTASSDIIAITSTTSVADYLKALDRKGKIDIEGTDGDYGFYITAVNGKAGEVISSTANSYEGYDWTFFIDFTTLEGDDAVYGSDWSTHQYEGKTLYSSNNGVSYTPCIEGHTYALVYTYSNMSW